MNGLEFAPRAVEGTSVLSTARSLYDLTFTALCDELAAAGLAATHAKALWRALYRGGLSLGSQSQNTSHPGPSGGGPAGGAKSKDPVDPWRIEPQLQRWLAEHFGPKSRWTANELDLAEDTASSDGLTRKFLLRLHDGQTIETVLMAFRGRHTACVSTQAGCAMGCVFCATGQMGFARHLRAGEIVAQVRYAQGALKATGAVGLRNLVLMGMGEPLHNYDAVMTALEIICDPRGINLGPTKITISTVGVVPGILRLAKERQPYNLAVSLHGSTHEERDALVPANRRWPLAELIDACRTYAAQTGRRIFFEWTLIDGKNDSPEVAERLAHLLAGLDAHINLIPLNPTQGFAGAASASDAAKEFQRVLRAGGFPSTIRQRRGIDVAAGCGQLRAEKVRDAA